MAKAREIIGLDCAADALEWAAIILRVRFEETISLRDAALDFSDIKGVHDMRVAARRLRSALRDFQPLLKKRRLKNVRKQLKRIADALGAVRDDDVAIVALEKMQAEVKTEQMKSGIEKLLEERRAQREQRRFNLIEVLADSRFTDLQKEFLTAIDQTANEENAARAKSFSEAGRKVVADRLAEFCDLSESLCTPFDFDALHEFRLAAKRLRYAIELFAVCWDESIASFAKKIAAMQSALGELHDCDVWIAYLSKRLVDNKNDIASPDDYQTAVRLLLVFVEKRTKNYRDALKLWSEWQETDFIRKMRLTVAE